MEWVDRLNIVVAVDQNNGFARDRRGFGVDQRWSITENLFRFHASRCKFSFNPICRLSHLCTLGAIGANAGNAEQFEELIQVTLTVVLQKAIDCGKNCHFGLRVSYDLFLQRPPGGGLQCNRVVANLFRNHVVLIIGLYLTTFTLALRTESNPHGKRKCLIPTLQSQNLSFDQRTLRPRARNNLDTTSFFGMIPSTHGNTLSR